MKEKWKNILDYNGIYQVSNLGNVKSFNCYNFKKPHLLSLRKDKRGYLYVGLTKNGKTKMKKVHRLVAEAFISKEQIKQYNNEKIDYDKLDVNHKDEDKTNNCVDNLEWCTHSYNAHYGTGIKRMGEKHRSKVVQISLNDDVIKIWNSIKEAALELNISKEGISSCCRKKSKTSGKYKWRYYNE